MCDNSIRNLQVEAPHTHTHTHTRTHNQNRRMYTQKETYTTHIEIHIYAYLLVDICMCGTSIRNTCIYIGIFSYLHIYIYMSHLVVSGRPLSCIFMSIWLVMCVWCFYSGVLWLCVASTRGFHRLGDVYI